MNSKNSFWDKINNFSATGTLIFFTTLLSCIEFVLLFIYPESISFLALQPSAIYSGKYLWTLVTHIFMHAGIAHLLINMFVLFSLGSLTERIIGRRRFFALYFGGGIFAGLLATYTALLFGNGKGEIFFGSPDKYMVGASGAIFAIAGLLMILLPKLRFSIIFLPFFSLPAYIMLPLVLALTWIVSALAKWNVGNVAHLGGFLVGIFFGTYLKIKYQRKVELLRRYFR